MRRAGGSAPLSVLPLLFHEFCLLVSEYDQALSDQMCTKLFDSRLERQAFLRTGEHVAPPLIVAVLQLSSLLSMLLLSKVLNLMHVTFHGTSHRVLTVRFLVTWIIPSGGTQRFQSTLVQCWLLLHWCCACEPVGGQSGGLLSLSISTL